jgi:hypothetical protein
LFSVFRPFFSFYTFIRKKIISFIFLSFNYVLNDKAHYTRKARVISQHKWTFFFSWSNEAIVLHVTSLHHCKFMVLNVINWLKQNRDGQIYFAIIIIIQCHECVCNHSVELVVFSSCNLHLATFWHVQNLLLKTLCLLDNTCKWFAWKSLTEVRFDNTVNWNQKIKLKDQKDLAIFYSCVSISLRHLSSDSTKSELLQPFLIKIS